MINDPAKLKQLAAAMKDRLADEDPTSQTGTLLDLLRGLAGHLDPTKPEQIEEMLDKAGALVASLSAEAMTELLKQRDAPENTTGPVNLIDAAVAQMEDGEIAQFVAGSVVQEEGASERLAEAFQALVPEPDRRRQVLALAETEASASPVGQEEHFTELWGNVENMLTSYTDVEYVSSAYARELSAARRQAVAVDQASDDPPERMAAWLDTVNDSQLRALDQQLLLDLLALETDGPRWRDVATLVIGSIDELARAGKLEAAERMLELIAQETDDGGQTELRPFAEDMLARLAKGRMMKAVLRQVRTADDHDYVTVKRLCARLGPAVISALADALASEQDKRAHRRLREILLSFGELAREAVQQLMQETSWEVRRTAASLLRELGGAEAFESLEALLNDPEPRVQREAIRTLLVTDDERARDAMTRLVSTSASARETLSDELTAVRDVRAAPLCVHFVRHLTPRTSTTLYLAAIKALGTVGGDGTPEALKEVLYRGDWWAPLRTRALRSAAAEALGKMGGPTALDVLREASTSGPRGVRAIARAERDQLKGTS